MAEARSRAPVVSDFGPSRAGIRQGPFPRLTVRHPPAKLWP
jgi:hypothetical protein